MPGPGMSIFQNLSNIWRESAFDGLFEGMLTDLLKDKRPNDLTDESVGAFFTRRTDSKIVDNLISAVLHGIYAGDVYKLSMRSIMPGVWNWEKEHDGIVAGFMASGQKTFLTQSDWTMLQSLEQNSDGQISTDHHMREVEHSSVFTFKHGLGALSKELEAVLNQNPMVKIRRETFVTDLSIVHQDSESRVSIWTRYSISL